MKILDKLNSKQPKKTSSDEGKKDVKKEKKDIVRKKSVSSKAKKAKPGVLAEKVLIKPLVTEKIVSFGEQNKYAFLVSHQANKIAIKEAIKEMYGVTPLQVNIINIKGKKVRYGRLSGKRKDKKKAIVTLKKGDKIEIYQGV